MTLALNVIVPSHCGQLYRKKNKKYTNRILKCTDSITYSEDNIKIIMPTNKLDQSYINVQQLFYGLPSSNSTYAPGLAK